VRDIAIEVTVGPPFITITRGNTFVISEPDGWITASTDQGIYSRDTRYVSKYEIFANGQRWILQNSGAIAYYASRAYLTNPSISTEYGEIKQGTISVVFSRAVHDGVQEDLDIWNYGMMRVRFSLELLLRTDFADIFEVKSKRVLRKGNVSTRWDQERAELTSLYEHDNFARSLITRFMHTGSVPNYTNGRVSFPIDLAPRGTWHACCQHLMDSVGSRDKPHRCVHLLRQPDSDVESELRDWKNVTTSITTSNEDVYRLFRQSVEDMAALRLPPDEMQDEVIPAAGVPWFVAPFGRDSLIVGLQNMMVYPDFARGALNVLGRLQATKLDDYRDAQPGKIMHELRVGELAQRNQVPHTPYYGTADATALYLITLHEAWKWLGDDRLFREHENVAKRCLEWIDQYGDLDGDGFQEYQTRSPHGYENMGWKDAGDSVIYSDGTFVKGPKALCELQGYTFDAWLRMAEVFEYFEQLDLASALRRKAAVLQQKFEESFWCEEMGTYAYALDGEKRQVRTIVSNPGHLLWSGLANPERARHVIARLLQPDIWSGWGIRTLSTKNPAFNPFSYQNGSIWPHDNGMIAMGCKRYGFSAEAAIIARGISEAASYFAFYRLPELYAGTVREEYAFPVQYLGANVPQAWAAGSVFHLLQSLLGLEAEGHNNLLWIDPELPRWLTDITLHHVRVGRGSLTLRFWREQEQTRFDVLSSTNEARVMHARKPEVTKP
jgi:glycogen debranching enzyme